MSLSMVCDEMVSYDRTAACLGVAEVYDLNQMASMIISVIKLLLKLSLLHSPKI